VDNLSNAKEESLRRVAEITGKTVSFYKVDLLDRDRMNSVFQKNSIDAVIHFAGLKAPGESVRIPLEYYKNNVCGTLTLLEIMQAKRVNSIVFSSSATVYGQPNAVPITEDFPLNPATNPYGCTKRVIEDMLRDLAKAEPQWNIAILRYFNPVGAHESGRIGEDPNGIPNNLLPYIAQVAVGKLPEVNVMGSDYDTPDGTGIRDYIHVVDLAIGHIKTLQKLATNPGVVTYNLGTGRGYSVLEMITAYERAAGKKISYKLVERRPGDVATTYADPSKAQKELFWVAERDLDDICRDSWRWQSANPDGYN
jgi:UDP-glucose 4-epimerase